MRSAVNESANFEVIQILKWMIKDLSSSCKSGKKEVDYTGLGESLLTLHQKLTNYYSNSNDLSILQELKKKLEDIKKWQLLDYNKELALSICRYLLKQRGNQEVVASPFHSSLKG